MTSAVTGLTVTKESKSTITSAPTSTATKSGGGLASSIEGAVSSPIHGNAGWKAAAPMAVERLAGVLIAALL